MNKRQLLKYSSNIIKHKLGFQNVKPCSHIRRLLNNNCCRTDDNNTLDAIPSYFSTQNALDLASLTKDMQVIQEFISEDEEKALLNEIDPYMKKMRYQFDHWDDAIHGYRETEKLQWKENNKEIINRIGSKAFDPESIQLHHVHILDLARNGHIKPHIDSERFCGNVIAGISLLSSCVMRLVHNEDKQVCIDVLLKRRSLYIMRDTARYNYTHEVLEESKSSFKGQTVPRERRISIICRNEPNKNLT